MSTFQNIRGVRNTCLKIWSTPGIRSRKQAPIKTPPEKQDNNEIMVRHLSLVSLYFVCKQNNLFFEAGSLLFLSFDTKRRGRIPKRMVDTAIPTRPQIFVSTKEKSEDFMFWDEEETSMSLPMIMVTRRSSLMLKSLCQMSTISAAVQFCCD